MKTEQGDTRRTAEAPAQAVTSHQKEYENTCKHTAVIPSIVYGQEGLISNLKPSQKER